MITVFRKVIYKGLLSIMPGTNIKTKSGYIEDIQFFGMNMPFILSEVKNAYFISGQATNEIYIIWLHEMK